MWENPPIYTCNTATHTIVGKYTVYNLCRVWTLSRGNDTVGLMTRVLTKHVTKLILPQCSPASQPPPCPIHHLYPPLPFPLLLPPLYSKASVVTVHPSILARVLKPAISRSPDLLRI